MPIWAPSQHDRFKQYLENHTLDRNERGQVITTEKYINSAASGIITDVVADSVTLEKEYGEVFDPGDNSFIWGRDKIQNAIGNDNITFESVNSGFDYCMGLLLEKLFVHNKLLSSLLEKIDHINKTRGLSKFGKARELYHVGCLQLSQGLLDRAVETFNEALEIYDADFFTHYHLGMLYLYGISGEYQLLDLDKAVDHLKLAAKYAKSELGVDQSMVGYAAMAYFHLSIAFYAGAGEPGIKDDNEKYIAKLNEARTMALEAVRLNPELSEAAYHLAKYAALIGDSNDAVFQLGQIIARDRDYAVKVEIDPAFDPIRPAVKELLEHMRDNARMVADEKFSSVSGAIGELETWFPDQDSKFHDDFIQCRNKLDEIKNRFETNTYFGYLDTVPPSENLFANIAKIREMRISELKNQIEQALAFKRALPESNRYAFPVGQAIDRCRLLLAESESSRSNLTAQSTFEQYRQALETAREVAEQADLARRLASREDGIRQENYEHSFYSREYASRGAKFGAVAGSLIGFVGCIATISASKEANLAPFGVFIACIILGTIIGALIGQGKANEKMRK